MGEGVLHADEMGEGGAPYCVVRRPDTHVGLVGSSFLMAFLPASLAHHWWATSSDGIPISGPGSPFLMAFLVASLAHHS